MTLNAKTAQNIKTPKTISYIARPLFHYFQKAHITLSLYRHHGEAVYNMIAGRIIFQGDLLPGATATDTGEG